VTDERLISPAAERNLLPIAAALAPRLPGRGLVLELASGTGQHAVAFAERFPALRWLPSDCDPRALASIRARRSDAGLANLLTPLPIDLAGEGWWHDLPEPPAAAFAANVTHISPWPTTQGLVAGVAAALRSEACLFLYGPFFERNKETAPSNLAFDRSLRQQDPAWGLREADAIDCLAEAAGLMAVERLGLPANNLMLCYRKEPA